MPLNARTIVVTVAALASMALTARLGVWQLDRAAQKTALETALDTRRSMTALPASQLARQPSEVPDQAHRAIVLKGRWSPLHTVYLENRQMNGRPGFFVVTPLLLPDGSAVDVQRGWVARDSNVRTRIDLPPPPEGDVQVAGRIAPPPSRLWDFGGAASGPIRQNLVLDDHARELGKPLRPLSIVQEDGPLTPPDGLLRQWPRPAADVHKHYGYAFQWFALAALIFGLYVWFQLIRPRRRR